MIIKADPGSVFVFDLDDTLYSEIDFLKSAYKSIAFKIEKENPIQFSKVMLDIYRSGGNTFEYLVESYPEKKITVENLLYLYRNHYPEIFLREGVVEMLIKIKNNNSKIGIITDGRSITQLNKIKSLGLEKFVDKIVISEDFGYEKPNPCLFESFMEKSLEKQYYYFGDNLSKDFIAPKKLGWLCIGVLDTKNIHAQNLSEFDSEYLPHFFIKKFTEIQIK